MGRLIHGRAVVPGTAAGEALVSREPLSFWGGYDSKTGEITDRRNVLYGRIAVGRILAIPFTRGSSTTTAVLLEAIRTGTAPTAIITEGIDSFLTLASIVADEMYGKPIPVIAVTADDYRVLETAQLIEVKVDGTLKIDDPPAPRLRQS